MDINTVANDFLAFTGRHGWKAITIDIAARYAAAGAGTVLEAVTCERSLKRNTTRLYRIFSGVQGARYRKKALALVEHVAAALVAMNRQHNGAGELVATGLKECDEAHRAALSNAPAEIIEKEALEAIAAVAAYIPGCRVSVQIVRF